MLQKDNQSVSDLEIDELIKQFDKSGKGDIHFVSVWFVIANHHLFFFVWQEHFLFEKILWIWNIWKLQLIFGSSIQVNNWQVTNFDKFHDFNGFRFFD